MRVPSSVRYGLVVVVLLVLTVVAASLGGGSGDGRRDIAPAATATVTATPTPAPPAGDLQTRNVEELQDDTPNSIPAPVLKQAEDVEEKVAEPLPPVGDPLPVGGAQGYSCRVDYASRASGSYGERRAGAKVMSFKLHYTVSSNTLGWGDVIAVGDYLERVGLSAHLIVDFEGHCLQRVPFAKNAFTEGAFNSTSESVEIIATGRETRAEWLASPLIRKRILASIVRDRLRARGLPLRFVDPVGCTDQLGYTDHNHLECRNNHVDVSPNFPFDVFQHQLADGPQPVTHTDVVTCRKLLWWRTHGKPQGKALRHAVRRRDALASRHVVCTARGPVRR